MKGAAAKALAKVSLGAENSTKPKQLIVEAQPIQQQAEDKEHAPRNKQVPGGKSAACNFFFMYNFLGRGLSCIKSI